MRLPSRPSEVAAEEAQEEEGLGEAEGRQADCRKAGCRKNTTAGRTSSTVRQGKSPGHAQPAAEQLAAVRPRRSLLGWRSTASITNAPTGCTAKRARACGRIQTHRRAEAVAEEEEEGGQQQQQQGEGEGEGTQPAAVVARAACETEAGQGGQRKARPPRWSCDLKRPDRIGTSFRSPSLGLLRRIAHGLFVLRRGRRLPLRLPGPDPCLQAPPRASASASRNRPLGLGSHFKRVIVRDHVQRQLRSVEWVRLVGEQVPSDHAPLHRHLRPRQDHRILHAMPVRSRNLSARNDCRLFAAAILPPSAPS